MNIKKQIIFHNINNEKNGFLSKSNIIIIFIVFAIK